MPRFSNNATRNAIRVLRVMKTLFANSGQEEKLTVMRYNSLEINLISLSAFKFAFQ